MTAQDKELFSQLYDRNYKRLLYAAIRIAHNPFTAEELTNEAFTILLTHFDRVRQHPNLPGWLHTVLTNLALDEYKRQSRYVQVPLDSVPPIFSARLFAIGIPRPVPPYSDRAVFRSCANGSNTCF